MNQPQSTLHEVNAFLRTIVMCVVVGGVGYGGGWVYQNLYPSAALREKDRQIQLAQEQLEVAQANAEQLQANLIQAKANIDRLHTSMRYLKVNRRVADLIVVRQMQHPTTGRALTELAFQEVDDKGMPIEQAQSFTIEGDIVYLDYWVVKFADEFVEQGDTDRGMSICMFKRLFGEYQEPKDGYVLDSFGQRPAVYGRHEMSPFEESLWADFWNLANDPSLAQQLGVRAAHGEAVSMQVREGAHYRVEMRASGGLTITPFHAGGPAAPQPDQTS